MNSDLRQFVHDGQLTWTMTTNGYKYYTLNLITWLRTCVKWNLCIICCDKESYTFFRREGIPCTLYGDQRGQAIAAVFATDEFAKWNKIKLELLQHIAANASTIGASMSLYLDGDIVVARDPWPTLKELWSFPDTPDFLFQCDCAHANEHQAANGCTTICSGVIAERHTSHSQVYEFDEAEWAAAAHQDQPYIANRLSKLAIPFYTLPRSLWGNGSWQKSGKMVPNWILLHYNYRVGGGKKVAMKRANHWKIPY